MHRLLRLAVVRVGTGHREGSAKTAVVSLNALRRADAQTLRFSLVRRDGPDGTADETADQTADETIARFDRRWLRFGPLSFASPVLGLSALGATYETLDILGYDPDHVLIPYLIDRLGEADLLVVSVLALVGLLLVGALGALGWYAETWWGFRLVREPSGGLRASRGLFVTRSATLEEERLHGVEVAEPLMLRLGGGAYTYAVATGARGAEEESSTFNTSALLPPAPIVESHWVAAEVLHEDENPGRTVSLVPHTRHALARRIRRAFLAGAGLGGALAGLGLWLWPALVHAGWICALAVWARRPAVRPRRLPQPGAMASREATWSRGTAA
ncbi:twin-arginine translocation signal domain-containing protein [Nonomuraea aridisoli]|uniref:PH domain-containing protein n=1 Tax=Nonomuraea aridisoli TaxID=2070368 RepID=A0A2W2DJ08_9ACTN|nr:twin-arginine translocation signal domain-containing protein [Nonomuraea aridisoli]PZG10763.1 hypothetical protein C1J01_35810 [Nonomuraea aridisoli]